MLLTLLLACAPIDEPKPEPEVPAWEALSQAMSAAPVVP